MAQLADETLPTVKDTTSFASRFDPRSGCFGTLFTTTHLVRPEIIDNWYAAASQLAAQLVERRIAYAEYLSQPRRIVSEAKAQLRGSQSRWMDRRVAAFMQ